MSLPKEMKAIVFHTKGDQAVKTISLPPLRPNYLLIKVECVALNPTDWKHVTHGQGASPFSIVGCDYAGTVVSIGSEVKKSFKRGDKIYGCAHGGNFNQPYDGVFAEYAMVMGDVAMHVPSPSTEADLESLSTVGLGSITVGQGMFQPGKDKSIGLNWPETPTDTKEWVLITGGSTATGSLAIQFAKLAGYRVLTTCSPRNTEFVKCRGADEVFDYNDPECGVKIRAFTENKLRYAWDTVAHWEVCDAALSTDSSICHYGTILSNQFPRRDEGVKYSFTLMYTMFGEEFYKYGKTFPVDEEDHIFAKRWMELTEKLVREGKLVPHPKKVGKGGLEGILNGIEDLRLEKVRGEKLVYPIAD